MKITINRQDFRKAFATATSITSSDSRSPYSSVLLAPKKNHVLLTSTNQNITLQTKVRAKCDPGPDVLLSRRVRPALSALDTKNVRLEFIDGRVKISAVRVSSYKATIVLKTLDRKRFPALPTFVADGPNVTIKPTLFRRAVESTWFATRQFVNNSMSILRLVNISVSENKMTFTATDGTRIARFVADVSCKKSKRLDFFNIHPDTLKQLRRLTRKSPVKICISNDNCAVFSFGDETRAIVPLALGKFPNLDSVFDSFDNESNHYETVSLKANEFAAMLSQASIMSTRAHQVLRLSLANNRLWSEIRTPEVGEARSSIEALSQSNNSLVTLDVQLLREGMDVLNQRARVNLSIPDKTMPLKIFTKNFTYVVMPFDNNTQQRHAYSDAIATSANLAGPVGR